MVESKLSLKQAQLEFASHIRNPAQNRAPASIEDRRMGIYRDLFYNNIEGFISSAFPVLRSISQDIYWHSLVRDFISEHRAKTPYFIEIAQEFLNYLSHQRASTEHLDDPNFILELAHYEWVELALDVAGAEIPVVTTFPEQALMSCSATVSPLVWCLTYAYPVHRIGPIFLSENTLQVPPEQPTHLIVYRNRQDKVRFMEANAVTLRLVQLIQGSAEGKIKDHLEVIAAELQQPLSEGFFNHAQRLLQQLHSLDIVVGFSCNTSQ